jgi:hypothetical protein
VLRDVARRVRLDEEVEVARLMVTGDRGVGSDDFFLGAVWLGEGGSDGNMLADWEAEDGGWGWEVEAVAVCVYQYAFFSLQGVTDIATLCEMMVFSLSSKSWNSAGLRTFCSPNRCVSVFHGDLQEGVLRETEFTYSRSRLCTLRVPQPEQWHTEANPSLRLRYQR